MELGRLVDVYSYAFLFAYLGVVFVSASACIPCRRRPDERRTNGKNLRRTDQISDSSYFKLPQKDVADPVQPVASKNERGPAAPIQPVPAKIEEGAAAPVQPVPPKIEVGAAAPVQPVPPKNVPEGQQVPSSHAPGSEAPKSNVTPLERLKQQQSSLAEQTDSRAPTSEAPNPKKRKKKEVKAESDKVEQEENVKEKKKGKKRTKKAEKEESSDDEEESHSKSHRKHPKRGKRKEEEESRKKPSNKNKRKEEEEESHSKSYKKYSKRRKSKEHEEKPHRGHLKKNKPKEEEEESQSKSHKKHKRPEREEEKKSSKETSDWLKASNIFDNMMKFTVNSLMKEPVVQQQRKPKVFPLNEKEIRISRGEVKKRNEYPTMNDVKSDWCSNSKKSSKREIKAKLVKEAGNRLQGKVAPVEKEEMVKEKKEDGEQKANKPIENIENSKIVNEVVKPLPDTPKKEPEKQEQRKPKMFELNEKEVLIAKGQVRKRNEYPTMNDVKSDWDSCSKKESKKESKKG
ncbi:hypothetical protein QR680_016939 [Steinernema hermaphroditum]|uniref:Uncharacterized protein n=1 Tax=Steinernema hermaphroditum TaxID=289476 RepID=A0AA39LND4_9BILA|nr:hypothetical protein QR680_016939 [Steinernema hermaphroditum]